MAYTPSQAPGPLPGASSTSVVTSTDTPFTVSAEDLLAVLNEIQVAVAAFASAKGILSDLRVTPTGSVTVAQATGTNLNAVVAQATAANLNATVVQATASSLNANVGNLALVGSANHQLTNFVPNIQNHTSQLAFTTNITRS